MELDSELGATLGAAKTAARTGRYQLLLGAGASVGASNARGQVPIGSELVALIAQEFTAIPIDATDSLSRAYQRVMMKTREDAVYRFLQRFFLHCSHQPWFTTFAALPWRRVWTVNVDDAFQNAYRNGSRVSRLASRTIAWDDSFSESGELEIVHLHGHVHDETPRRLVFSFSEYARAARERPVWDQVLAGVLATEPILAFGARLLEDPDIENLFANNRPSNRAPSIVVDPYISDNNAWELSQLGYHVIRCDGESLTTAWENAFDLGQVELADLYSNTSIALPQLTELQTNRIPPQPPSHDFFGGDEPLWSDACADKPAFLHWMETVLQDFESWLDSTPRTPRLHIVFGQRLTGVSTGVLAIARVARQRNAEVLYFDKSSRFNVPRLIDYCRDRGPILLMIDGGADFGNDIDRLARDAIKEDTVELYVLVSERTQNDLKLEGRLTGSYDKVALTVPARLDRDGASSIVKKLDRFARLGMLETVDPKTRHSHFVGRDVFSGMMDVEYALGFRKRVQGELDALDADWKRKLILLLAIASQEARPVGLREASFALGVSMERLTAEVIQDEHLQALVEHVDDRLVSRQRDRPLQYVLEKWGPERSLAVLLGLVRGLAPLATRQGLIERNRAAVIVGHLMNAKQLRSLFPSSDVDAFYESLRDIFGDWNGRYWEQRAILAKLELRWPQAESYAGRAVTLYDFAYTRTTYGTILVNRAADLAARRDEAWRRYYLRGKSEFEVAQGQEPSNRVTAFAFLESTLSLLERLCEGGQNDDSEFSPDSRVPLDDWSATYATVRVSLSADVGFQSIRRLESLSARYSRLPPQE